MRSVFETYLTIGPSPLSLPVHSVI